MFGGITNKNIAKQTKLLKFVKSLNDRIDELLCFHQEKTLSKMENAKIEFQKGYKLYLVLESSNLTNNVFKIPSSISGEYHNVDLNKWHCSCLTFNQNGNTCKHMFYVLIEKAIEKGMDYKKLQNVDVFDFLKQTRKFFVKEEKFIKLIEQEEFPVTIGVDAFFRKYEKYIFK